MKKEIKICLICHNEFLAIINSYGNEVIASPYCNECASKLSRERDLKRYQDKVNKLNMDTRNSWIKSCGIKGMFLNKTLDSFDKVKQPLAYKAISNYHGNSITLLSPKVYGVGKTHLVCALGLKLLNETTPVENDEINFTIKFRKCPVMFTTEAELLIRIRNTFNNQIPDRENEEDIYKELASIPLLMIDDVGKIQPKDPTFMQGVYYRVIDARYVNELPIIITTNLDYAQLESHIGGASADRLKGMCGENMIKMVGKSFR